MSNTKILSTLGPSSLKEDIIRDMMEAGVTLFRINLSHTRLEDIREIVGFIRGCTNVPICLDSEGAQIRTQSLAAGAVHMEAKSNVTLHFDEVLGDEHNLSFHPIGVARNFDVGDLIDIDFHGVQLKVTEISESACKAEVVKGGKMGENKAVALGRPFVLPALTDKDIGAIKIGRELGIDHYALSFANRPEDVDEFRSLVGDEAFIITKIESISGIQNLRAIADRADAILIDRGDLSREAPIEKIPFLQRRIISTVRSRDKPVYVATNLLESMIESHQPTRAEVNDVVSTLEMGATGLVLAAETAIGAHPVNSVRTIRQLIRNFERWTPNTSFAELLEDN
jgi:pyruvate kinase